VDGAGALELESPEEEEDDDEALPAFPNRACAGWATTNASTTSTGVTEAKTCRTDMTRWLYVRRGISFTLERG